MRSVLADEAGVGAGTEKGFPGQGHKMWHRQAFLSGTPASCRRVPITCALCPLQDKHTLALVTVRTSQCRPFIVLGTTSQRVCHSVKHNHACMVGFHLQPYLTPFPVRVFGCRSHWDPP